MSDSSQGEGWWVASNGKWYAPEQHPDYATPAAPPAPPNYNADTLAVPLGSPSAVAEQPTQPGPAFASAGEATQTYSAQVPSDPNYNLPETDSPSSSKRSLILGIGAAVLIIGLCFLAYRFFTGDSAAGGAASPQEAIDQLVASVNEKDTVGFIEVFDPDEIEAWFGSFTPAAARFEELDDVSGELRNEYTDAYLSVFDSFEYSLTGPNGDPLTYEVDQLDDAGRINRVRVQGIDFSLAVGESDTTLIFADDSDSGGLNLPAFDGVGIELRDQRDGLAATLLRPGFPTENEFGENAHLDFVVVEKDGKWFVSIGYSLLEIARNQGEFDRNPDPDFGRAFELVDTQTGGAESPEALVQAFFDSAEDLDYERIIELIDPLATPYLHDYQALIDSEIDDRDRRDAAQELGLSFDDLELDVSEWEGRTLVTLGDVGGRFDGGAFDIDTATWCGTFSDDFESVDGCLTDAIDELLFEIGSREDPASFIPEQTGFVVVQRNGRWYMDALGTMGFYTDQLSEATVRLTNELETSAFAEVGDIFFAEGPIARQGVPRTAQAIQGAAGVALDLTDYPVVQSDFQDFHVAVARVGSTSSGTFVSRDDVELTGEDWIVAYQATGSGDQEFVLPAVAITTAGDIDVELFEVAVTNVGLDGYTGQLGGQGRPQIFVFSDEAENVDITIDGALADVISDFDSSNVSLPDPFGREFISSGAFAVVYGEPGATFTITVAAFEPEPEPELVPTPTPTPEIFGGDFDDLRVEAFSDFVSDQGYGFSQSQIGGFFDGCGPDDPDVISSWFEDFNGALVVITPYPSAPRAEAAFEALLSVSTPCETFADIQVNDIVELSDTDIRIEWQDVGDDDSVTYEHYRLSGSTVVVATGPLDQIDNQLAFLNDW